MFLYSLIKHNDIIYTYDNEEFIDTQLSEPLSESDFMDNGIADLSIIPKADWEYFNDTFEILIGSESNDVDVSFDYLGISSIKYLVSTDNQTWYGYNGEGWVENYTMSKQVFEALTGPSLKDFVNQTTGDNSIYKTNFYYKAILSSNSDTEIPLLTQIDTIYKANQKPLIQDPRIEPDQVHNNHAEVKGTFIDLEGGNIEYRVLIKKAGEQEFYVANDWITVSTGHEFLRAYNYPYFNLGTNEVKVEFKDDRGVEGNTWTGNVTVQSQDPTITYTYTPFSVSGVIGDPDGYQVAYKIAVNGVDKMDYTDYFQEPLSFDYMWESEDVTFGEENTITIYAKDPLGATYEESFTVIGSYRSLLFLDPEGNYYSTDEGELLKYLEVEELVAGQDSEPKKVTLLNQSADNLEDVQISTNRKQLPLNANVVLSTSNNPFVATSLLTLPEVFAYGDDMDFYVAIHTQPGAGRSNAEFEINTTGAIIES